MLTMEFDKDFEAVILEALLEVERDLSLLTNSLINNLPDATIQPPLEKKKSLSVCLDKHFMPRVRANHLYTLNSSSVKFGR